MKKLTYLLLFVTVCLSCEKQNKLPIQDFGGYYRLYAVTAEKEVDINNDGISSNNIFHEYVSTTPKNFAYYNPDWLSNYAEIRPAIFETGGGKLASFNFHCQEISNNKK